MLPGAALQVWLAAMATDARASTSPPQQQRRGERPQDEGKGKNLAWSRTEMTSMRQVARMDVLQYLGPALLSACSACHHFAPAVLPPPAQVCREAAASGGCSSRTSRALDRVAASSCSTTTPARSGDGTRGTGHAAQGAGRVRTGCHGGGAGGANARTRGQHVAEPGMRQATARDSLHAALSPPLPSHRAKPTAAILGTQGSYACLRSRAPYAEPLAPAQARLALAKWHRTAAEKCQAPWAQCWDCQSNAAGQRSGKGRRQKEEVSSETKAARGGSGQAGKATIRLHRQLCGCSAGLHVVRTAATSSACAVPAAGTGWQRCEAGCAPQSLLVLHAQLLLDPARTAGRAGETCGGNVAHGPMQATNRGGGMCRGDGCDDSRGARPGSLALLAWEWCVCAGARQDTHFEPSAGLCCRSQQASKAKAATAEEQGRHRPVAHHVVGWMSQKAVMPAAPPHSARDCRVAGAACGATPSTRMQARNQTACNKRVYAAPPQGAGQHTCTAVGPGASRFKVSCTGLGQARHALSGRQANDAHNE